LSKKKIKGVTPCEKTANQDQEFSLGIKFKKSLSLAARTPNQIELFKSIKNNLITIVSGNAGTGKTLLSVVSGLKSFSKGEYGKMIFTRPCVEANDENLGFLPGDLNAKISPYMMPIFDFLSDYMDADAIEKLSRENMLQTIPLAFLRGVTFKNAFVLLDESQNATVKQLRTFLTRIGDNCKVVITGDPNQSDIKGENGLSDALKRFRDVQDINIVELTEEDICRHPVVARIEKKYEDLDKK